MYALTHAPTQLVRGQQGVLSPFAFGSDAIHNAEKVLLMHVVQLGLGLRLQ